MSTSTVAICTHAAPTSMSRPYSAMLPASFTIICRNYIMRPGLCQAGFIGARPARATQGGAVDVCPPSGSCARALLTNPQRYCAPLISSRAPTPFAYQLRCCALIGSCTPDRISTPRLITASARLPAVMRGLYSQTRNATARHLSAAAPTPLTYPRHPHARSRPPCGASRMVPTSIAP